MRRFIVSSKKFIGSAELLYFDNAITVIDMRNAQMPVEILREFKKAVPVTVDGIAEAFSSDTTVVEAEFMVSFDMFWTKYDRKINRIRAEKVWNQIGKVDQVSAWAGIGAYDKFLRKDGAWRRKADPEKYLRDRYWENDYSTL